MRHVISILLQNEAGALARVAGLFAARGYNIDSLTVAATHDPQMSRLTMVLTGDNEVIEQILSQTRKLVDVLDAADLTARGHLESELLIVKLEVSEASVDALDACLYRHHSFTIAESEQVRTVQFAGPGPLADAFIKDLGAVTRILELARSGAAALQHGPNVLGGAVA